MLNNNGFKIPLIVKSKELGFDNKNEVHQEKHGRHCFAGGIFSFN